MQAASWMRRLSARLVNSVVRIDADRRLGRRDRRTAPLSFERLEDRVLLAAFTVAVNPQDILTAQSGDWYQQASAISAGNPQDVFTFTLTQLTGVFIDIDARDIGLSNLDSVVRVFSGSTEVAFNDDGFDFEGFDPDLGSSLDSSIYADLGPGTYQARVTGFASSTGAYLMRMLFDTSYAAAVPVLNSFIGATDTLYLDFDGHAATDAWGTYSALPFNFGGGPANTFSPGERLAIRNIWEVVSEDYSPFNLNVTTVNPGVFADQTSFRMVITESNGSIVNASGALGVAFLNSYANGGAANQTAWTFAGTFSTHGAGSTAGWSGRIMAGGIEMGNTTSHEFGHALGLHHYNSMSGGFAGSADIIPNAIMATPDFGLNREVWAIGARNEQGFPQNDIQVIASAANGIGFRTDDHGNTRAAATVLLPSNLRYTAAGIISHPTTDLDYFRFEAAGNTTIYVDVREFSNNLDVEIRLLDVNGVQIAASDPPNSYDASISMSLAAGVYFLEVRSDGENGELGQYTVLIETAGLLNNPPTATSDNFVTDEATPVNGNLISVNNGGGIDSDPENGPLTLTAINGNPITNGQIITLASGARLTIFTNGNFTYDPNGALEHIRAGNFLDDTFLYTIADNVGLTASAQVTVRVNGLNDDPVARNNARTTNEDTPVNGNLISDNDGFGVDSDPDVGDVLTVVRINGAVFTPGTAITLGSGARLTVFSNGNYTYDPTGAFDYLTSAGVFNDSFTYAIFDGLVLSNTATVALTITGVNDAPTATNNFKTTTEVASVPGNMLTDDDGFGVDTDPDSANITVSRINGLFVTNGQTVTLPSGARLTVNSNGNYLYNPNGRFEDLGIGQFRDDTFTYTVSDGVGGHANAQVTIRVTGLNDPPTAVANSYTTAESALLSGNLIADNSGQGVDRDIDGDAITLTRINGAPIVNNQIVTLPSGALLTIQTNGSFVYNPNGVFNALNDGQTAQDVFNYTIEDPAGLPAAAQVTVTIDGATQRVFINGTNVSIVGSGFDDVFVFNAQLLTISINGAVTQLPLGTQFVSLDGGAGNDQLFLIGTTGNDRFLLHPTTALLDFIAARPGFDFVAASVETVAADGNGGTFDQAFLHDSAGDDVFTARPREASLVGPGFVNRVVNMHSIAGRATTGGGLDQAFLFDSPGNDAFSAGPLLANLSGPGFFLQASGFSRVTGNAVNGGLDLAMLHDSPGADVFEFNLTTARLSGPQFFNLAVDFEVVSATSHAGGDDLAIINDTPGNDRFVSRQELSFLAGPTFVAVTAFETVSARSIRGGFDQAFFYDSPGNDVFTASHTVATMAGQNRTREALNFNVVAGWAVFGGNDTAILFDTPGNDTVDMRRGLTNFSGPAGLYLQALGFTTVSARSVVGGVDRAFLHDTAGNDTFESTPAVASLSGPGYVSQAVGFDTVLARASLGVDRAVFFDSEGNDLFVANRTSATMSGPGYFNQGVGFDIISAFASEGFDVARITDSPVNDLFVGRGHDGTLTSAGFSIFVTRFDTVNLFGTQGGVNRLDIRNLIYLLNPSGAWTLV